MLEATCDTAIPPTRVQEPPVRREPPVSLATRLGYGSGAVGAQIFRDTPALILPIYMITVLGIPAWMAGIAILIPKAWIVFCDPLVGGWSDRRAASWGRAPFLGAGALLSGLAFVLMFSAPDFASPLASAAYMSLAFALASTAYSLFSVPYLSVASEMSESPRERTTILAYRLVFLAIGVAIGAGYALPVAQWLGDGWHGFNRMGLLYGAVCLVSMGVTWATVRRTRLITLPRPEGATGKGDILALWRNRSFVSLSTTYFVALTAQGMTYTVFGLFFLYVLHDAGALAIVNVFAAASVLVAQPLTVWLSKRFSKRALFVTGVLGWSLFCLSWITAGPTENAWIAAHIGIPAPSMALMALRGFLWGLFNSMYLLMALSMLTDTIQHDRETTGASRAGVYSGVFSALEKVAFALGPAITGVLLSLGGFVGAKGSGTVPQSSAALTTLVLCFAVYPAVLKALSLIAFIRYRGD
ncbi:MFS transporter [Novosphingobium guangzhouense]|uniref:Sugar transporter n=1 Tax=Novosphingobium guangzhouense TaxID=1850347 RepID=A0A2K2FX45_9SPHN|nr:MFS transporter [Novosphingobium guangzhouense]PNU03343.1 hypothetical protein A8V01_06345 [Novosphingobium guangzhouense]